MEPFVLHEHGLPNPVTQERSFLINSFDKLAVNMTSCSKVEEVTTEDDGRKGNSSGEKDKTVAALDAIPICLNWGQVLSSPDETR